MATELDFLQARRRMVTEQLMERGIHDARVLAAFLKVPRHFFVPVHERPRAYEDHPLGIGGGQTISQPYIVALMLEALQVEPGRNVLEIGTGSGYQTALLAELGARVCTMERIAGLCDQARARLQGLGYASVQFRVGDGTLGWPEESPFDRIIVSAAAPKVPPALVSQLASGGRMVIPVGDLDAQGLMVVDKPAQGPLKEENTCGCVFVPLIGVDGWPERSPAEPGRGNALDDGETH